MHRLLLTAALVMPTAVFAMGGDDKDPPTTTSTTTECSDGQVWSVDEAKCVDAQSGALDDDALYRAAREFAYAGRYADTLNVLAAMSDAGDDRVLTYKGFVHRKLGDNELGNAYYRQAIAKNPDNLLARTYMGMGFVEADDLVAAVGQWHEIVDRGGRGTWPEEALRAAIETGITTSY